MRLFKLINVVIFVQFILFKSYAIETGHKNGFIENKGQIVDVNLKQVPHVLFEAKLNNVSVYLTTKGLTYAFSKIEKDSNSFTGKYELSWFNVELINASISKKNIETTEELNEEINYFTPELPNGIYNLKKYQVITINEIYPGIDWKIYITKEGQLKYDFVVHKPENVHLIQMKYFSETPLASDKEGNLNIETPLGKFIENKPFSYLKEDNSTVSSRFKVTPLNDNESLVSFEFDANLRLNETLIIDPLLTFGTVFGGNQSDMVHSTTSDGNGNVFLVGYTGSTNFPLMAGGFNQVVNLSTDLFISKFSNNGVLLWSTYYGGSAGDAGSDIDFDNANNIYVLGYTNSTNLPVQNLAGAYNQSVTNGNDEFFLIKFNSSGIRQWASYFGGSQFDYAYNLDVDPSGTVFVTGNTNSTNLPIQNLAGSYNQAVKSGGNDGFIIKFNSSLALVWSTYYGGSGEDMVYDCTIDNLGNSYFTGETTSPNFPLLNLAGAYNQSTISFTSFTLPFPPFTTFVNYINNAFVLKFDNAGVRQWASFVGGSNEEIGYNIKNDASNNVVLVGSTKSTDFPIQNLAGAYNQSTIGGGVVLYPDVFIVKFDPAGSMIWSTYYGGTLNEDFFLYDNLDIDICGNIYISTYSDGISPLTTSSCGFDNNTYASTAGYPKLILLKINKQGAISWDSSFGINEIWGTIDVDVNSNIFWTAFINANTDMPNYTFLNGGGGSYFGNSFLGGGDTYFSKLSADIPNYTSSLTDNTNCLCNGEITVNVNCTSSLISYNWSNGVNQTDVNTTSSTISSLCGGNYWVEIKSECTIIDTLTFTISPCPLPIELLVFDGIAETNHNKLYWQTESENNNDYFTLERSLNGIMWEEVGIVDGAGNSTQTLDYQLPDYDFEYSVVYYRLKQTDFNQNSSYSQMIALTRNDIEIADIYPNPSSNGEVEIKIISNISADLSVIINDQFGKMVLNQKYHVEPGINEFKLNTTSLSSAIYYIHAETNTGLQTSTKQIIIK